MKELPEGGSAENMCSRHESGDHNCSVRVTLVLQCQIHWKVGEFLGAFVEWPGTNQAIRGFRSEPSDLWPSIDVASRTEGTFVHDELHERGRGRGRVPHRWK